MSLSSAPLVSPRIRCRASSLTAGLVLAAAGLQAPETNLALVALNRQPFFYGREYFVLRSGRAQLIVQADRVDLGPAFTYLLFDAQNARQSVSKEGACNFIPGQGFAASALGVELGGFVFTALGHRTDPRVGAGGAVGQTPSGDW